MKKYNVLWFDDQHTEFEIWKEEARNSGINLFGFTNAEDGLKDLENKIQFYDAVIVDGKFYKSSRSTGDTVNDDALFNVARELDKLENIKKIPWFIFSGQPDFIDKRNRIAAEYKNDKVYNKNSDADFNQLMIDLKLEADKQIETQIRHKYQRVFEVCTDKYIGNLASKHLMDILYNIEYPNANFDDEKYFNGLRKVVELVFRATKDIGLLHEKCIAGGIVNLTWSSLFLAGKDVDLKPQSMKISSTKIYFPKILAENIKSLLEITNAGSHTEGDERQQSKLHLGEYKKLITSNYLLYSIIFHVMDLILWYKKISDEYPNYNENKKQWIESSSLVDNNWISGKITRIANNGYGTFQPDIGGTLLSILPNKIKELNLSENQSIEIITKVEGSKTLVDKIRVN